MDVLASRILLPPADFGRSQHFYRDLLELAVYREFGAATHPGIVFFLGGGFLEISGEGEQQPRSADLSLWLQVRDVHAEHQRLSSRGVPIVRSPQLEPWGLIEMWISDPDGVRIVLVEIPADHPLRRDARTANDA
jgi:predicted enzyme related to lactoylglutathione lyase